MTSVRFLISIEVEREQGKFAGRDEIADRFDEALQNAVEDVDLSGLGADANSEYTVVSSEVDELDSKTLRQINAEHEQRVREELPGDDKLRASVKHLRSELQKAQDKVEALKREVQSYRKEQESHKTRIYVPSTLSDKKTYLPDGKFDRVRYEFDDHNYVDISFEGEFLQLHGSGYGGFALHPTASNVLRLKFAGWQ